jgi:hypothetical protein
MPAKSKAQARFFLAHKGENSKVGKIADEFIPHGKGSMKKLPEHASTEQRKHMADVMRSVKE